MKIYTLEYLEKEATDIAGYWNGSDERFIDGSGEPRHAEEAIAASELLEKIVEVRKLITELSI